jgi:7-keto-8-aminopelargonate synthetase-like enzyme
MVESTTLQASREQQCRRNAQRKSERKRQAVLEAITALQQANLPVTKTTVVKQAQVSYPFLAKHADLLQAIEARGGWQCQEAGKWTYRSGSRCGASSDAAPDGKVEAAGAAQRG